MPIAVFGNKSFTVSSTKIKTFNELTWGGDILTEAQEKLNSKPSTYIKGSNLNNMSFNIQLKSSLGHNVRVEIEEWESIKENAKPFLFILGTKPLGNNKWLLKSTNCSGSVIDNKGNLLEAVLKLDFEEYIRQGSADGTKKASTKGAAVSVDQEVSSYVTKPTNKSNNKRNNPNVEKAVANGTKK